MTFVKPKKFLGQHFLLDEQIASDVAAAVSATDGNVIEVGAGTAMLTKYLIKRNFPNLIAVEIDRESIAFLKSNYPDLNILEEDFLKLDFQSIFKGSIAIVGNFPYHISSQILFKAIENKQQVTELVGMFQLEVAQRITSQKGSKNYGILSVLTQAFFDTEMLFKVPASAFNPPPKVVSAVIRIKRNNVEELPCDEQQFVKTVKTAFNQRRKTLRNALKPITNYDGKYASLRAEQLDVQDFIYLCKEIFS